MSAPGLSVPPEDDDDLFSLFLEGAAEWDWTTIHSEDVEKGGEKGGDVVLPAPEWQGAEHDREGPKEKKRRGLRTEGAGGLGYIPRTAEEKVRAFFLYKLFELYNCGDFEKLKELLQKYCATGGFLYVSNTLTENVHSYEALATYMGTMAELIPDSLFLFESVCVATGGERHLAALKEKCAAEHNTDPNSALPTPGQNCVVATATFSGTRLSGTETASSIFEKNLLNPRSLPTLTASIEASRLPVLQSSSTDLNTLPAADVASGFPPDISPTPQFEATTRTTLVFDSSNKIIIWKTEVIPWP